MIAEQTALHSPKQTAVTGAWRAPVDLPHLIGIRAVARHLIRSLTEWARVPALPYARSVGGVGGRELAEPARVVRLRSTCCGHVRLDRRVAARLTPRSLADWHIDEPVAALERMGPECGRLEVLILALLFSERPT